MEEIILKYEEIEIYDSDIEILEDTYLRSIKIDNINDLKVQQFNGLLLYIYNHKLKYILSDYKVKHHNRNNYELLDEIFYKLYVPLCYRYCFNPNIEQFCSILCHISLDNITDIKNGFYRTSNAKVNSDATHIVKKWYDTTKSGYITSVSAKNGIGDIFILKALYGLRDSDAVQQVIVSHDEHKTVEQIQEKYQNAEKPELLDILKDDE